MASGFEASEFLLRPVERILVRVNGTTTQTINTIYCRKLLNTCNTLQLSDIMLYSHWGSSRLNFLPYCHVPHFVTAALSPDPPKNLLSNIPSRPNQVNHI